MRWRRTSSASLKGAETRNEFSKVLWATLYVDDAAITSRSQDGLAKIMKAIVEVHAAFGLVVAEKKTVTIHMRSSKKEADVVEMEAAGQGLKNV